jgi:hypothetical protein
MHSTKTFKTRPLSELHKISEERRKELTICEQEVIDLKIQLEKAKLKEHRAKERLHTVNFWIESKMINLQD